MHIRIEAETGHGLRIIEEIPDFPISKIEGYNGIGKTNAIKLLRLCTGDQPFENDLSAWRTFRRHLAAARVQVTGLYGGRTIDINLDPERWPTKPEPLGDLLGSVRIDGTLALPADIPDVLRVFHILTTETPLEILAKRALRAERDLRSWLEYEAEPRQNDLDKIIGAVQVRISDCLPAQLPQELHAAESARRLLSGATSELDEAKRLAGLLEKAVEVADRLDQVRGRGPELDAKLGEIRRRLADLDDRKRTLDEQIEGASASQTANQAAEHEFDLAQKHLVRQDKSFRLAKTSLEKVAAAAGVAPERAPVSSRIADLSGQLAEMVDLLPQVNATPMLISVLTDLADRLEDGERHDLAGSVLIEASDAFPGLTVSQLRDLCQIQAEKLSRRTPSAQAEKLESQIDSVRNQLDALSQMAEKLDELDIAEGNLHRAEERLRNAVEGLPEQAARTVEELMANRNTLDDESRSLQGDEARFSQARDLLGGGLDEAALAAELHSLCQEARVDPGRVRGRRERHLAEIDDLTRRQIAIQQQFEKASRLADARTTQILEVGKELATDPRYEWLRAAHRELNQIRQRDASGYAEVLDGLSTKLAVARNRLEASYRGTSSVAQAFQRLHGELRSPSTGQVRTSRWDLAARTWLADQVRRWFNDDFLSAALFDGARDIRLDSSSLTVAWTGAEGPNEIPLAAFSSGQQAFAYTHARVAQLDQGPASENRLIALDEFGSYLDADRMNDLLGYLASRARANPYDQIVVVLPLERTPQLTPDSSERDHQRVEELQKRGYIAESVLS
ncbi:hypothetical protein Ais01nite_68080 [Asanoa ishikariensis]|uniref:Exonuclease SbcCD, C subunit n=1 Tax=Asanoa ishikariensis TaxID=137265 RepID=A0A1H3NB44_9ACTN|nr:hypothetical protein [Asanoa ishikariensis]GIF68773.1 hypothetical protein Ais01nite_68080 [Asanoa ishikariensis]SDY85429.1 hypothetical protein SAMN05421684_1921 [Asanoa ishikariensis]